MRPVETKSDRSRMAKSGPEWNRLLQTCRDRLVQTGPDRSREVQTGPEQSRMVRTDTDRFRLVQIGSDWSDPF